jgi:hypothetical protein
MGRNLPLENQNDIHSFLTSSNVPAFTALIEEREENGISGTIRVFLGAKYTNGYVRCTFKKINSTDTNSYEGSIAAAAFIKIISIVEEFSR